MEDRELGEIKERLKKASFGPWRYNDAGCSIEAFTDEQYKCCEFTTMGGTYQSILLHTPWIQFEPKNLIEQTKANIDFIVNARTDIPRLISEMQCLKDQNSYLIRQLEARREKK